MSRSRMLYIAALVIGWAGLWFGRQMPHVVHKDLKSSNRALAATIPSAEAAKIAPQVEAIESLPPPIEVEKIR
ncbi:MAG: hypothetical protein KA715_13710 [Xanthomonadaceae bacterium]|nr:hypothetical protein [Xanthomonadaceae bacterium]